MGFARETGTTGLGPMGPRPRTVPDARSRSLARIEPDALSTGPAVGMMIGQFRIHAEGAVLVVGLGRVVVGMPLRIVANCRTVTFAACGPKRSRSDVKLNGPNPAAWARSTSARK